MKTLPDYLQPGLDILFVGINPGLSSLAAGHYFASPRNRFWPALNGSGLASEHLTAHTDKRVLRHGIGLTDLVKRPSRGVSALTASDFRQSIAPFTDKIARYGPAIVCFLGVLGCRNYVKYALAERPKVTLGLQCWRILGSRVFLAPSPSPANAAYSLEDITGWFVSLKQVSDKLKKSRKES